MKRLLFVPLVLLGGCLWGCSYKQVGTSEWGWKQESRWSFYQETKASKEDEQSSFDVNLESLVGHIIDLQGEGTSVELVKASAAAGKLTASSGKVPREKPQVTYHLAVLSEPSGVTVTTNPPDGDKVLIAGVPFFVEVWATKSSPDLDPDPPHDPGISCAYVDLVSHEPVDEIGIEHSVAFAVGAPFVSGTFDGGGGVMNLGSCTFAPGGAGVGPEWALLATIQLQKGDKGKVRFELTNPTHGGLGTSVYGQGYADPNYGKGCQVNVQKPRG